MKYLIVPYTLLMAVMMLLMTSCGEREVPKEAEEQNALDLLSYVPADTPYVLTNSKRAPRSVSEKLLNIAALGFGNSNDSPMVMIQDEDEPGSKLVQAILAELEGKISPEGFESLGLRVNGRYLAYGLGLLPVVRIEIADQQKVRDFISRVELRSGMKAPVTEQAGHSYWRFDMHKFVGIMAVTDQYMIAALLPAKLESETLPIVLGNKKPDQSLADTGDFQKLLNNNGFTGYGEGYIDFRKIVEIFLGESKGMNAAVWKALEAEDLEQSPACINLLNELTRSVPRIVIGTKELSEQRIRVQGIFETSPGVSAHLQKLATPVPGLGDDSNAMVAFGLALNLPELRTAITSAIYNIQQQGKDCEWVKQDELTKGLQATNMMLNPIFAGIKGTYIELNDLDLDEKSLQPKSIDANLMLATDDPRGIFGMLGMVNPQLAQLRLPNDGSAVKLPLEGVIPLSDVPPTYVAAKEKLLALSIGENAQQRVEESLNASLVSPMPILEMSMDVDKYYKTVANIMENMPNQYDAAPDEKAQILHQQLVAMKEMGKLYDRMSITIIGTDKGLVLDEVIDLK